MIKTSERVDELAAALATFQASLTPITKDATNPHLKNRYASLTNIMNEIRPLLYEQGLAVSQGVIGGDGQVGIVTRIMHDSGQWQEAAILIPIGEPGPGRSLVQEVGSKLTYLRRYSLAGALGLTVDEDDDGQGSTTRPAAPKTRAKKAAAKGNGKGPAAEPPPPPEELIQKAAYWESLGPVERACYRSWDNVIGAIKDLPRYKDNDFGATGAIRKLFPATEQNGLPKSADAAAGRSRVTIYRTVKAYAELRDTGMESERAVGAAFGAARNIAPS